MAGRAMAILILAGCSLIVKKRHVQKAVSPWLGLDIGLGLLGRIARLKSEVLPVDS